MKKLIYYIGLNFLLIIIVLIIEVFIFKLIAKSDNFNIARQVSLVKCLFETFSVTLFAILIINYLLIKKVSNPQQKEIGWKIFLVNFVLFLITICLNIPYWF